MFFCRLKQTNGVKLPREQKALRAIKAVQAFQAFIALKAFFQFYCMHPKNLTTKIFLDSGDPEETKQALDILGFLDGQTTNPSLVAKNPTLTEKKFTRDELFAEYRSIAQAISVLIPNGSVSVEVYARADSAVEDLLAQAHQMYAWIPNAHIKLPITQSGLAAAQQLVSEGIRVNMTLCFSQAQATAVYAATKGATEGQVFISPFIGRLDDVGNDGMSLIKNIKKMYMAGDGHVQILAASIRGIEHFVSSIENQADIITAPIKIISAWHEAGMPITRVDSAEESSKVLKEIPYQELDLNFDWHTFNLEHPLTEAGIAKFVADWDQLIKS